MLSFRRPLLFVALAVMLVLFFSSSVMCADVAPSPSPSSPPSSPLPSPPLPSPATVATAAATDLKSTIFAMQQATRDAIASMWKKSALDRLVDMMRRRKEEEQHKGEEEKTKKNEAASALCSSPVIAAVDPKNHHPTVDHHYNLASHLRNHHHPKHQHGGSMNEVDKLRLARIEATKKAHKSSFGHRGENPTSDHTGDDDHHHCSGTACCYGCKFNPKQFRCSAMCKICCKEGTAAQCSDDGPKCECKSSNGTTVEGSLTSIKHDLTTQFGEDKVATQ